MSSLVTLAQGKQAARITDTDENEELQRLLDEAEALVLDAILNRAEDADTWAATVAAWDDETVPSDIRGAILRQFVATERFRGGDDPKAEPVWIHGLDPRAWAIVQKYRDPSLA